MAEIPHWGKWQAFRDETEQAIASADPIGLLLAEHEWLRSIISETDESLHQGASISTEERRAQQAIVWGFIDAHIHKEEDAVFPALEKLFIANAITEVQTETMYGEHDAIRIRYEELQEVLDQGSEPGLAFRHLWRALVVHFDNEEQYIFDNARPFMTPDVGQELIRRLTSSEFEPPAALDDEPKR